ncbi:MAG: hypothetical protein ACE5K9_03430 [Candidatus Methylomirabilales bacterium]
MSGKLVIFVVLLSLVWSACATTEAPPPGRVGELRGKIVQVEREQGLIAVGSDSEDGEQWFQLKPYTAMSGPDGSRVSALKAGERVYVRYLQEPQADPPEVLSITVLRYTLKPSGTGVGSVGIPGF